MSTFETKVADIFKENPRLVRKIPVVIKRLFHESEADFGRRINNSPEYMQQTELMQLFDILYIDFYYDELKGNFISWVIKNYPERFTPAELEEMQAQAVSHLDYYEVQEAIPGKGSYVKSLTTNREGFLIDISTSSKLVKWDIIFSRFYIYKNNYYATGAVMAYTPNDKEYLLERIGKAYQEYVNANPGADYAEFAKRKWDIFFTIDADLREQALNKKIYTSFGEFQQCEVRFNVNNYRAILNKMKTLDEFEFVEMKTVNRGKKKNIPRYMFNWITRGIEEKLNPIRTNERSDGYFIQMNQVDLEGNQVGLESIGNFYIDTMLGRLETKSLELAEFAMRHFTEVFGSALTFKRINKINLDSATTAHGESDEQEPSGEVEVNPALRSKIEEQLYLNMLDDEIPMLQHKSPREAAKIPELRPILIDWLKSIENQSERRQKSGEQGFSLDRIKKELGVSW